MVVSPVLYDQGLWSYNITTPNIKYTRVCLNILLLTLLLNTYTIHLNVKLFLSPLQPKKILS